MTTSAIPGYGTLFKIGDGATPETFTTVVEVTEITPPKIELKTEDVTHHSSNGWEEFIGTLLSGGEINCKVNWRPTDPTHDETTGLLYTILNRVKKNWKVVLPGSIKTFAFAALLTKFEPETPVKGAMSASCTLKISGPVTPS